MTTVNRPNPLLQMANYRKIHAMAPISVGPIPAWPPPTDFSCAPIRNQSLRAEAVREAKRALELEPPTARAIWPWLLALPRSTGTARGAFAERHEGRSRFRPAAVMEGRLRLAVGRDRDALFWFKSRPQHRPAPQQ
jgi:hypothetical protein